MKLHLDTDIGGHIDDLCALAMVLGWPGVELVGVTTVAEQQGVRAGYARYALALAGRSNIDVAAGADVSLGCFRDAQPIPDPAEYWPGPISAAPGSLDDALDLLERSIAQHATIVAIGPCTNLALLEKRTPGILRQASLFLMGGYVVPPRSGFPQFDHRRDYNVQVDASSAYDVVHATHPVFVPVSLTVETALRHAHLPALRAGGPLARLIAQQAEAFARAEDYASRYGSTCARVPGDLIYFLHDPLACAIALGWRDGVEIAHIRLQTTVVDGWLHQVVSDAGNDTTFVTRVAGARFSDEWLQRVTAPPA